MTPETRSPAQRKASGPSLILNEPRTTGNGSAGRPSSILVYLDAIDAHQLQALADKSSGRNYYNRGRPHAALGSRFTSCGDRSTPQPDHGGHRGASLLRP